MAEKAELVFIPMAGMGHLVSTVEIAKLILDSDDRLSITVLIMKSGFDSKITAYIESLAAGNLSERIRFIELPKSEFSREANNSKSFFFDFIESNKPLVKDAVEKLKIRSETTPESPKLAGFVIDMFCTCMIDVANDFGVPSYMFFTSSASFLGLMLHVQILHDERNKSTVEMKNTDAELNLPTLVSPVPARVLPSVLLDYEWATTWHVQARRFKETKGIMVNTFMELESYGINALSDGKTPPIFPVGPILNLKGDSYGLTVGDANKKDEIVTWLDDQPCSSVVFLCFGSMGSFGEEQVKEIAGALEQSGQRFLWSLRRAPPRGKMESPSDYADLSEVLSKGFLERTVGVGKVIGWAPQTTILSHPAIGGFVSHCGWNSTLESIWYGVPIATWPMYAEQQFNAFYLVRELGLAVDIKMDYRNHFQTDIEPDIVSAEEIERGIRRLMEQDSETRKRVKKMSDLSKMALMDVLLKQIWKYVHYNLPEDVNYTTTKINSDTSNTAKKQTNLKTRNSAATKADNQKSKKKKKDQGPQNNIAMLQWQRK